MTSIRPRQLHLLVNRKSGQGHSKYLAEKAKRICEELNYSLVNYEINHPKDLDQQAERAVCAAKNSNDVVVAAGGDGTIRSVAEKAAGQPVQFAVVPCGTFNFFA